MQLALCQLQVDAAGAGTMMGARLGVACMAMVRLASAAPFDVDPPQKGHGWHGFASGPRVLRVFGRVAGGFRRFTWCD